jgi:phosphate transport system substrate-binding protein
VYYKHVERKEDKRNMNKLFKSAMVLGVSAAMVGCSSTSSDTADSEDSSSTVSGTITAAGSSALKPLVDEAADAFSEANPDVSITVDAGGSGEGLKQVSEGTVTIGNSDVEASEKLDASAAEELVDHQVCVVTMAPIVNKDVTESGVTDLTKDQLIKIFTGEITNWSEVGGADEDIVLVTRPTSSGTRATFQKYALDGNEEASNASMETDDSGVLLQNVQDTKGAIGYVALSYLVDNDDVDTLSIDGVEPTLENTYSGDWKVWTFEHMYTKGDADEANQAFIDYIMGEKFGKKMEKLGYGVSSKMENTDH